MVRVTQPSGGKTQLDAYDDPPSPKAVRVLKPPGGGSSISFGGDDEVEVVKRKTSTTSASGVAGAVGGQEEAVKEASTDATNGSSPAKEEAVASETTKTDGNHSSTEASVKLVAKSEVKSVESSTDAQVIVADKVTESVVEVTDKLERTTVSANSSTIETRTDTKTNGEESFPKVSFKDTTASVDTATQSSDAPGTPSGEAMGTPASNGDSGSPDTKNRLFGANKQMTPAPVGRETPSNHHMRSSIFTGSEDCYTAKSSVKTVCDTPTAPPQRAPTRVRQPPGGFSSKLW